MSPIPEFKRAQEHGSYRDGDDEVFVMNADGSEQTQLTDNTCKDGSASWSPNGTHIAFASDCDGQLEIHMVTGWGKDCCIFSKSGGGGLGAGCARPQTPHFSPFY
ncbi:MAG: PD40 domain-containing protein [Anaerolineae bacterium]|nr:PD40 domain-containing protein [Anaerolineae bacterium]